MGGKKLQYADQILIKDTHTHTHTHKTLSTWNMAAPIMATN